MPRESNSLRDGIRLGGRATTLALFLLTPFVYYKLGGGGWAIGIGLFAAIVPLVSTLLYVRRYREAEQDSVGRIATNFLVGSAFMVVYLCLRYESRQTAPLRLATWVVAGITLGIMWDPYWAQDPDRTPAKLWRMTVASIRSIWNRNDVPGEDQRLAPTVEWLLVFYLIWAFIESLRKGAAIGPGMIAGLYTGFLLSYLVRHIWQDWLEVWRKLIAYFWHLVIIYVFAGLFAMLWRFNPAYWNPGIQDCRLQNCELHFDDFLYYSLSTVSTLGYSLIRPVSLLAKVLTSAEFLVGIFWVTAVVGLLFSRAHEEHSQATARAQAKSAGQQ